MSGSLSRLISLATVLAAITAPALAQAPSPKTLSVFDLDQASVKPGVIDQLKNAINVSTTDNGCYPPTMFTASVPDMGDYLFITTLGKARVQALKDALTSPKLASDQFDVAWAAGKDAPWATGKDKDTGEVRVTYGGDGKEGPVLKVIWSPVTKGTKVTSGKVIPVSIEASERHDEGHKTWPTGVRIVQLLEGPEGQQNLIKATPPQGLKPPECHRANLNATYTVPSNNPPPVVHLTVMAENGAGHRNFETADFPLGDWYGTIKAHVSGTPSSYNDTAEIEFSFDEAQNGTLRGRAHAKMTNAGSLAADGCSVTHTQQPSEADFPIGGHHMGNEFQLDIPTNLQAKIQFTADKCQHGPNPRTYPATPQDLAFFTAMAPNFYHPKVDARDGARNTLSAMPGVDRTEATIELHQATK
jgi:hypothetical protein